MTDRRRIEYTTDMDARGFETGARGIKDRLREVGTAFQEQGIVGLSQFSQFMGYSVRDMGQMAVEWGKTAVSMAIDGGKIKETAESFRDVFKDASDTIQTKLGDARRAMGLSKSEMEKLLTPIGLMATNAGFAADESGRLAGKLLTMAGDIATFMPSVGSAEEALRDMQAAIRGEFDPLEKWGIKLSAAKVQAEKLRLEGIDPATAAMSDSQLEMYAMISLIEQGLGPALGELDRNSENLEIKVRELESAWKDARDAAARAANEGLGPLIGKTADATTAALDAENPIARVTLALDALAGMVFQRTGPALSDLGGFMDRDLPKDMDKTRNKLNQEFTPAFSRASDVIEQQILKQLQEFREAQGPTRQSMSDTMYIVDGYAWAWDNLARKIQAAKREHLELRELLGGGGTGGGGGSGGIGKPPGDPL